MAVPHETDEFRKSSYSAQETDCTEVRHDLGALRDSKNPQGPVLRGNIRWLATVIKAGKFDS